MTDIKLIDQKPAVLERRNEAVKEIQEPAQEQDSLPQLFDVESLLQIGMSPVNAAQSLISLVPVPNFLPSVNPGSFAQIASSISSSGTFEPGAIFAQAQQLKELICNFTPPDIKIPEFDKLFDVNIEDIEEYFKNAFKMFEDLDPSKLAENLGKQILKQLEDQFNQFTSLFTECQKDEDSA